MFVHQALKYSSLIMYNFLFLTALEIYNYESIITENLTELNSYTGIQRGIVNIMDRVKIVQLTFLDPNICPQNLDDYQPYRTKTSTYLLALCDNGALYIMMSGPGLELDPICITPP